MYVSCGAFFACFHKGNADDLSPFPPFSKHFCLLFVAHCRFFKNDFQPFLPIFFRLDWYGMVDKKFVGLKEVFPLSHIAYKPLGLKWTRAMRECMCEATAYMSFFQSKQQTINRQLQLCRCPTGCRGYNQGGRKGGKGSIFSGGPRKSPSLSKNSTFRDELLQSSE